MRGRGRSVAANLSALVLCGVLAGVLLAASALPVVGTGGLVAKSASEAFVNLPAALDMPPLPETSHLYAADGSVITSFYDEHRVWTSLEAIPPIMRQAIVAAEDVRFYSHRGVDPEGILRAFVRNQQAGEIQQGASTLTQQYVRNVLKYAAKTEDERRQATEDTAARKLREMRYALSVEKKLAKSEILERYLNIAFFGNGGYGVGAAAQRYFSKPASELTLPESALLAGLVQSPSAYNPIGRDPGPALTRRNYVLQRMVDEKFITQAEGEDAQKAPLGLRPKKPEGSCVNGNRAYGFFCDWFLEWWRSNPAFGKTRIEREHELRKGGYRIVSSLDPRMQGAAQRAVDSQVSRSSNFATGIVLVEPGTGRVKAMAINRTYSLAPNPGGRDAPNTVNPLLTGTSVSPGYQAGSTFKLFTLVAALAQGLPLSTKINSPSRIKSIYRGATGPVACAGDYWCPKNATPKMAGTHTMWSGFGESVNTYFVQLEQKVTVKSAVNMAERLGVRFRSSEDVRLRDYVQQRPNGAWGSFTLGTPLVTPLDMATAYATIAARGKRCDPTPVLSIVDRDGAPVRQGGPHCRQVIPVDVADAAADAARCPVGQAAMQACAIRNGATARRVGTTIRRPIAGKTGTTDSNKAAWFVGFTPNLAAAVFFADPDNPTRRPVPTYRVPVTVFLQTMQPALALLPVQNFVRPPAIRAYGKNPPPTGAGAGRATTGQPRRRR